MRVRMSIDGSDETIRKIKLFDMKMQKEAKAIIKETATDVRKRSKAASPVSPSSRKKKYGRPGDLKRSIRTRFYEEGLAAEVKPGSKLGWHAPFVGGGTKTRRTRKSGAFRGKMEANPFMDAARKAANASYNSKMRSLFKEDTEV